MVTMNIDRIMKRGDYKDKDTLRVTSFFRTIQGEGPYAGYPAIFLRLSGCNFGDKDDHCSWCDTSFEYDKGKDYGIQEIMDALKNLEGYRPTDILVITGGEPLLQDKLIDLFIHNDIYREFKQIQVETNGTQSYFFSRYYDYKDPHGASVCFVVSPKASKRLGGYARLSGVAMASATCLKFVVSADPQDPQHKIPDWAFEHKCVYVSPMAVYKRPYAGEVSSIWDDDLIDREATKANYAYAAEYTMKHGLLLSLQTHLFTAVP